MTRKVDARPLPHRLEIPERSALRRRPLMTSRLRLAPVEPADGPELWQAVAASREHLTPWLPWVPYNTSAEASQRYADACAADWDTGRALRFAIRSVRRQRFLGVVGLDNCVHVHQNCDLGYWLRSDATGQGVMTEAARVCLRFGFETVGFHRIRCAAATHNEKSIAVIGRLGFQREGTARDAEFVDGHWVDHAIFSRLSSDLAPGTG